MKYTNKTIKSELLIAANDLHQQRTILFYLLEKTIAQLQQQGKIVTVKQLPSTINRRRKSYL